MGELTAIGDDYGRTACLHYLGLVDEQAGDYASAARRFEAARVELTRLEVRGVTMDSLAGMARCALMQGQLDAARQHVTEVWVSLSEHGTVGIEQPTLCYLTCADIFDALGDDETRRTAIEAGYRELLTRAGKISNAEWRKSFLENVAEHRAMVELWERVSAEKA